MADEVAAHVDTPVLGVGGQVLGMGTVGRLGGPGFHRAAPLDRLCDFALAVQGVAGHQRAREVEQAEQAARGPGFMRPPKGAFVIAVPVIGGMGVTWLVTSFAPEARDHGVPEVMDAIYDRRGVIRPIAAVVRSLAWTLSIRSGAAAGGLRHVVVTREGSIVGAVAASIRLYLPA